MKIADFKTIAFVANYWIRIIIDENLDSVFQKGQSLAVNATQHNELRIEDITEPAQDGNSSRPQSEPLYLIQHTCIPLRISRFVESADDSGSEILCTDYSDWVFDSEMPSALFDITPTVGMQLYIPSRQNRLD